MKEFKLSRKQVQELYNIAAVTPTAKQFILVEEITSGIGAAVTVKIDDDTIFELTDFNSW